MEPTIGDHLRRIRTQSTLTQEQLAERAGVSVETVRKLEQNERTSARMSTLAKLARALRVPTSALIGSAVQAQAMREPDAAPLGLLGVRRALQPARGLGGLLVDPGPETEPPTVADVDQAVKAADRMYHDNDFASVLSALPSLLDEARLLPEVTTGDDQVAAYALYARAHQLAGRLLVQMRHDDLAHAALSRALDAADQSGDRVVGAASVWPMCWLLMRQARFGEAERLASVTATAVEPRISTATPAELSSWGWLLLYGAAAAARDSRDDDARTILDVAAAAAQRVDDQADEQPGGRYGGYGMAKVAMVRVEAAVIAGDPERALALSAQVPAGGRVTPSCRQRWQLDVAWSYAQTGRYADATGVLVRLRDRAPAWLRQQRYAREIVLAIADQRRRAMSRELADLASLVGCAI